jgi:hypothetical protein
LLPKLFRSIRHLAVLSPMLRCAVRSGFCRNGRAEVRFIVHVSDWGCYPDAGRLPGPVRLATLYEWPTIHSETSPSTASNAHEVLPRRDVHLAAAEAATFGVQMPCHNQCDRESAERCGAIGRWWSAGSLPPGCSRRRTSAKSMAIEIRGRWPRSWASISSSANRRRS